MRFAQTGISCVVALLCNHSKVEAVDKSGIDLSAVDRPDWWTAIEQTVSCSTPVQTLPK